MYKKILVTGAGGFIGANLVRYFLNLGFDIHAVLHKKSSSWRIADLLRNIQTHELDLADGKACRKTMQKIRPDYIFHTAAYGGYPGQNETDKIINTNLVGTIHLLNACRDVDFQLFVNTGSSSEYGLKSAPMKESDPPEPQTCYGVSKAAASLYARSVFLKEKRPVTILRLFSPYGYLEGASRLVPTVILSCLRKSKMKLSSPDNVRDFIFIEDVMEAYLETIQNKNKAGGEIFNIGAGKQYSVRDIVTKVMQLTKCKIGPRWGFIENRRIEPKHWTADITKADKILKWRPRFTIEEGLTKTIAWFKKHEGL